MALQTQVDPGYCSYSMDAVVNTLRQRLPTTARYNSTLAFSQSRYSTVLAGAVDSCVLVNSFSVNASYNVEYSVLISCYQINAVYVLTNTPNENYRLPIICILKKEAVMPSTYRRKGRTIQREAREVVRRVIEGCDLEDAKSRLQFNINEPNRRAAFYTGFSERTIFRIRRECHETDGGKFSAPQEVEEAHQATTSDEAPDVCDVQVVRNALMDFYLVHKVIPTRSKLLAAIMKKKKEVQWGINTFRKLLKDIGFKWKKFERTRKILLERPEMSLWRFEYLKAIKKARDDNKNIIYVGDTWVDNRLNIRNCWHSGEWSVLQTSRFIIVEAGNENGFVELAQHITKVGQTTHHCDLLNYDNFKKWLTEKLLPNIPQNSVIVLDGSESYHMAEQNRAPSKYATKSEMIEWLEKNNVSFSSEMCKVELTELINKFKGNRKVYSVDELLKRKGHSVLRLPPYMCELNPLHYVWKKLDKLLTEKKTTEAASLTLTSFKKLRAIIVEALGDITAADWESYCSQVQKREVDYWVMDGTLDAEMEDIIADVGNSETLGSATDSGSEFSDSFSDDEEWPPFELVECGEEPTMGYEDQQVPPVRQQSILETILENPKPTGRNANRTSSEKKRKRKQDKAAATQSTNGDDTSHDDNAKTLSPVDATQLKNEMQETPNKRLRVDQQNSGDAASGSTSSEQFAEVLIKEEVMLVDAPMAKNVFGEDEELPIIEIKQERSIDDEHNPLDATTTMEDN